MTKKYFLHLLKYFIYIFRIPDLTRLTKYTRITKKSDMITCTLFKVSANSFGRFLQNWFNNQSFNQNPQGKLIWRVLRKVFLPTPSSNLQVIDQVISWKLLCCEGSTVPLNHPWLKILKFDFSKRLFPLFLPGLTR